MSKMSFSAVIMFILFLIIMAINTSLFAVTITICALLSFNELFTLKYKKKKELNIIKYISMIFLTVILLNGIFYNINITITFMIGLLALIVPVVILDNDKYSLVDVIYILGMIIFLVIAFGAIIKLGDSDLTSSIYIFVLTFITDAYTYIGNRLIGNKTIIKNVNKTYEGSLFGIVMGTLIASVLHYNLIGSNLLLSITISLVLCAISEVGDILFTKTIKKIGIEDDITAYGNVLNRFDSIIIVTLIYTLLISL